VRYHLKRKSMLANTSVDIASRCSRKCLAVTQFGRPLGGENTGIRG
jgi:hypothetical protein